jgi:hypothetical protein
MSLRDELPENKIDCPICGEIVELDDFDFIEDCCIHCLNEPEEEINEELESENDTAEWVRKQNIT